ncbi:MAG: uracil phosphoribosyltransferase [Pseudomonadota bacterium]
MPQISSQIDHGYPDQTVLLNHPYLSSLTAKVSLPETTQPLFNQIVKEIYAQILVAIMNDHWPLVERDLKTRMCEFHPEQRLKAHIFDPNQKAVCVDIARAGMLPSQVFFDHLNTVVDPSGIRQDHVYASRVTNEKNEVTHTELSSSKIGGDVDNSIVLIPDPMGATGLSLCEVIDYYKEKVPGKATKFIAAHLIVTPEYIKQVSERHPDVWIYAARLDRGLSSQEALAQVPGQLWDQESGLNDNQYIVPGAGGVGELINNSFV